MNISDARKAISPGQVALTSILLAVLLVAAFVEAATRENILFHQVLNTVRVTMVLFAVAMCLLVLPDTSGKKITSWLLFWTASFVSYLVHIYISFMIFFHGSFGEFYGAQGAFVATVNLVITAWWLFDVLMSWFSDLDAKWVQVQRTGIHVVILLTFFVSTVILPGVDNKEAVVIVLGALQALSVLICFVIRLRARKQATGGPP